MNNTVYDFLIIKVEVSTGADPGFPLGGGANPPGGGANLCFCQKFPKNHMKLRKFWVMGGVRAGGAPLRSATGQF